mgnify:FL=1
MIKKKKICVDMSCTIIHHGHIRLLKKASKFGRVYVALTSDQEIRKYKKIEPELKFSQRKEVLQACKYVHKVIKSKFNIDNNFMKKHKLEKLIHGIDNGNSLDKKYVFTFSRTPNISSTNIRYKSFKNYKKINQ